MIVAPSMLMYFLLFDPDYLDIDFVPPEQIELDTPYKWPMLDAASIGLNKEDEKQYVGEIAPGGKAVIPYSDAPVNSRFCFKNYLRSLQGYWYCGGSWIHLDGALSGAVRGTPANMKHPWGPSVEDNMVSIEPCIDVVLPINEVPIDAQLDQRVIQIQADMRVEFPAPRYRMINDTQIRGYVNHTERLTHSSEIYVLTTEEVQQYETLQAQSHEAYRVRVQKERWTSIFEAILLCMGMILLATFVGRKIGIRVNWRYWLPSFKPFLIGMGVIFVILLATFIGRKTGIQANWKDWLPDDVRRWLMQRGRQGLGSFSARVVWL